MIQTQTFEFNPNNEDELRVIAHVLELIACKRYTEATAALIKRHDKLTAVPKLKLYDQREHA